MTTKQIQHFFFVVAILFLVFFLVTSGCSTVTTLSNTAKNMASMPKMSINLQQNPTVLNDPNAPKPTQTINVSATPTTRPAYVYV